MAENSKIEWTTHTFNPWWGCVKVSAACDNCYAETLAARFGTQWGKDAPRKFFGDKHWRQPLTWNEKAKDAPEKPRVFCASMADVFEDNDSLLEERARLFRLIEATPNLNWLLLTKRPHLMTRFAPADWADGWPDNVWAMTTVEDQTWANARIPHLLKVPAKVRGLSMEPLVGQVDLSKWIGVCNDCDAMIDSHRDGFVGYGEHHDDEPPLHWIITGGESGHGARPAPAKWYQSLRDQSVAAGVPFLFKQWGQWLPSGQRAAHNEPYATTVTTNPSGFIRYTDKHDAGRFLDGRTWDERPLFAEEGVCA